MPADRNRRHRKSLIRARFKTTLLVEQLEERLVLSGVIYNKIQPLQGGSAPTPDPVGYTPTQIRHAYGFDQITFNDNGKIIPADGTGTTIAIVDVADDPNIVNDLHQFDLTFGLPDPPSFTKFDQNGGSNLPMSTDPNVIGVPIADTIGETALDVEWAHAIAPGAKIDLVEADSFLGNSLDVAYATAGGLPGVDVVSISIGGPEDPVNQPAEDTNDFLGHPGVTYVASSGDSGAPVSFPAISPYVLSVGGTTTNLDSAGNIISESGWGYFDTSALGEEGSGGGLSTVESQPLYQVGVVTQTSTVRTNPDVAYDADPETGFPEYDTFVNPGDAPWNIIGGTSDAAPQWAALIAIADQGRALSGLGSLDGPTQTLPMIYAAPSADFNDITTGTTFGNPNYDAGPGYDLVTGLGTPVANRLVADLVGLNVVGSSPAVGSTINFQATSFTINFSFPVDPSTLSASAFTVNGLQANGVVLSNNDLTATFTYSASPVTNSGLYTMSIAGGSFTMQGDPTATNSGFTGSFSYAINPVSQFVVQASATGDIAGQAFSVTVLAEDRFGNTVSNYTGTVHFTVTDRGAGVTLPANYTFGGADDGAHGFTNAFTLATAGTQFITVTDVANSDLTGTSPVITVSAGPLSQLAINVPSTIAAGRPFFFAVTAQDNFNNVITGFSGTLSFTSSDPKVQPGAGLPVTTTLQSGTGFFSAFLKTLGSQTITVTDLASSLTSTSNSVVVSPAAASYFVVTAVVPSHPGALSGPTSFATTGQPLRFTVTAFDAFNNFVPSYAGTVQFTSNDSAASLPAASVLTGGIGTFSATLRTPGAQTITATDAVHNSGPGAIAGTSASIATRGLLVTSVTPTPSGITVVFNKPFNPSTVDLYSPNGLPDDVMLSTAGSQVSIRGSALFDSTDTILTFVKSATVTATGAFNPSAALLVPGKYTLTLRGFSAGGNGFQDALGSPLDGVSSGIPGTSFQFTFTVTAPAVAVGIPDFARGPSNTDALFLPPTLTNGSTLALAYTNPSATPPTGTATITFSTSATVLQSNIQAALTSGGLAKQIGTGTGGTPNAVVIITNETAAGANVLVTFQGSLASATNQLLSSTTAGVSIGLATINVANNIPGSGIPVALSNGQNVTSGTFTLQYNPSLLQITGAVSKIAGASFTIVSNNAATGTLVVSLSSPTSISATTSAITLGSLLATVPLSAASTYGAKQLLHFSSEQLAGKNGPIAITGADAVEVAAYFGDVADLGGPPALRDASAIAVVATQVANSSAQTIPGFSAFPNLDPAIIGDVSLQGTVNLTDAGAINQVVGGQSRTTIPYAPIGLAIAPAGPDPTLSVDPGQWTANGSILEVPVSIDTARPQGSTGMVDAMLALTFDPTDFYVSATDVRLGTVPQSGNGWQLKTEVNAQTGLIGIEIYSDIPIASTAGGTLVTVALHSRQAPGADLSTPPLTVVSYVDPTGGHAVYQTHVADGQGAFVLDVDNNAQPVDIALPPSGTALRTSDSGIPPAIVDQVFAALAPSGAQNFILNPPAALQPLLDSSVDEQVAYLEQTSAGGLLAVTANLLDDKVLEQEGAQPKSLETLLDADQM
jgi:hypothetical protein